MATRISEIVSEADMKKILDDLFLESEHGDAEHRQWLKDKFYDFHRRMYDSEGSQTEA